MDGCEAASHSDSLDMTLSPASAVATQLRVEFERQEPTQRRQEPVTGGIPLPRGVCRDASNVSVIAGDGRPVPLQTRVLDRWPDNSIRWLLLDAQLDHPGDYGLHVGGNPQEAEWRSRLHVRRDSARTTIDTGVIAVELSSASGILMESKTHGSGHPGPAHVVVSLTAVSGRVSPVTFTHVTIEEQGPLRACVRLEGTVEVESGLFALVVTRLHFFAGSSVVRAAVTVQNSRPARHAGGYWELGDPGSILFEDMSLDVEFPKGPALAWCHLGAGTAFSLNLPAELYQDSSGGENWRSANTSTARVVFPSTSVDTSCGTETNGRLVIVQHRPPGSRMGEGRILVAATVRHFWQNFPKAIEGTTAA